jgi:hypothetical protein
MSIIIDAMDANKCAVPHCAKKAKTWEALNSTKRVASQYGGMIMHGVGTRVFMFDDELKKDGSLWVTIMVKTLTDEKKRRDEKGIAGPETLYLQMDNGPDNKNVPIFSLGELLVRLGIFKKVKYSFLPVGHTHEDIDASFGACSHILSRNNAFTIDEVSGVWHKAWKSTKSFEYINVRTW